MTNTVSTTRTSTTHKIVVTAMLSAVAFALMFIEVPIPALIPSFVKMDISDLPELLGAFALGPVYGSIICLLKNLLHILIKGTSSGGAGELCNFLLGVFLVVTECPEGRPTGACGFPTREEALRSRHLRRPHASHPRRNRE